MASLRENIIATAKAYIDGFNMATPDGVVAGRTPDCKQVIRPGSLPGPMKDTPFTNKQYQGFILPGFHFIRNIQLTLATDQGILVDETMRTAILHLESTGETDFGPYNNEYIIMLSMTENGKAIRKVFEFTDSAYILSVNAKIAEKVAQMES